ncbi:carbohydrate ABC transporter permease [Paenibacillus sp. R14(2021)]|uniref:carbohydrate ABC transporter permease n=1 Tax=Paenibacillus sp. R14(2021) TaxID=2859228 RepID=UPI001C612840|nr:carbohydrate ABC transporter permease [Paenibacillus sp. R14(2021)]
MTKRMPLSRGFIYLILIVCLVMFVFPFVLLFLNAFKTNAQIIDSPLSLPTAVHWDTLRSVITEMHYFSSLRNTFFLTVSGVVLISLFSSMTAHYIVRNKTKFNNTFFFTMVAAMIIPFQAIMIPMVSIYGQYLGWIQSNPLTTLVFLYLGFGSSLAVFIYHGFVKSIPTELEEAARIDGCNSRQTFFKIVLPILTPTTVTIGILNMLWIWNDFLLPILVLQNAGTDSLTLPLSISVFNGTYSSDYEKFLPAVLLVTLPILVIYLFAQRFILQGVTQGAVK